MPRFHHPLRQPRSQETLDRILDAAEQVLGEKSFTEATLGEIMDRTGLTVGAFYRRFPDKDALIHVLDERFFDEVRARADEVLDPDRWTGDSPREIVDEFARQAVEVYTRRRGLLRSLFLRARTDAVLQTSALEVNRYFISKLLAVILPRRAFLTHPDPERGIELGYMMMVGALRELIVFGEVWPAPPTDPGLIASEISRLYRGYLGIE